MDPQIQQFMDILKVDYPEYEKFHAYIAGVLLAMGHNPYDDYEILIEDLNEPTTIGITIHPTYGS